MEVVDDRVPASRPHVVVVIRYVVGITPRCSRAGATAPAEPPLVLFGFSRLKPLRDALIGNYGHKVKFIKYCYFQEMLTVYLQW